MTPARVVARALFAAVVILLACEWLIGQLQREDFARDLFAYWQAGESARTRSVLYEPDWTVTTGSALPYVYPPHLAALLSLLPRSNATTFARAWVVLIFASYWITAALIARIIARRWTFHGTLLAGVLMLFAPRLLVVVNYGNADMLVMLGVALAFAFPVIGGHAFGAAALLKVWVVWAIMPALARAEWRTVWQMAITAFVLSALAIAITGPTYFWRETLTFATGVLPEIVAGRFDFREARVTGLSAFWTFWPHNVSITAVLGIEGMSASVLAVAVPFTAAVLGRSMPHAAHYTLTLAVALLFAPLCRPEYLPALLPGILAAWRERSSRRHLQLAHDAEPAYVLPRLNR